MKSGTYGVTRSGYQYEITSAAELVRQAGEHFTWTCGEKYCGTVVQGGSQALTAHRHTVHPEIYGQVYPKL